MVLPVNVKKFLYNAIPTTYTVDGVEFTTKNTNGKVALGEYSSPTINLSFIGDSTPHYESIGDFEEIDGNVLTNKDVRTVTARYKVGANNQLLTADETITFQLGTLQYSLNHTPVVKVNSIGSFVEGTDFNLINNDTIEWVGNTPADSEDFVVSYEYIEDGYWLVNAIADLLLKDIRTNVQSALTDYSVDILRISDITDLSEIYSDVQVSALAFDVRLVYNYSWSRTLTDEDGPLIDQIQLDLSEENSDSETHTI